MSLQCRDIHIRQYWSIIFFQLPYKNVALKFNYCDGGASDRHIGFNGLCSVDNMRRNVKKVKGWCSDVNNLCYQYCSNKCTYQELQQYMENGSYVCGDSRLLRDWKAHIEGPPYTLPAGVRKNSLCVLTTQLPGKKKFTDRVVFGTFLVGDFWDKGEKDDVYSRGCAGMEAQPVASRDIADSDILIEIYCIFFFLGFKTHFGYMEPGCIAGYGYFRQRGDGFVF